jgi:hypothetical protein
MGDFVSIYGSAAPCERRCRRCGCRLRHANLTGICSPCDDALHPWTMPTYTRKQDACPGCGGPKMRASRRCRNCANDGVRLDLTSHKALA